MRWRNILNIIGMLNMFLGVSMGMALLCGLYYRDGSVQPLFKSMVITVLSGFVFYFGSRRSKIESISQKEGIAIVAFSWLMAGLLGALPFYFSESFSLFVDAYFESVSGFTTTGSSVLKNIESLSRGLLLWRSLIQWLGGMGIIVLSVAILPYLGVGGVQLYKAEVPSPVPDKLRPRVRDTALILWKVYALMSAIQAGLLMLGGMDLFDSICHALTTMPTGGFALKNASVAHYNSAYIDMVINFFMLMAGINFALHYQFLRGRPLVFWQDSECRFFLAVVLILTVLVSFNVYGPVYQSVGEALRYGSFQVISFLTTTGFITADYEKWPAFSQMILLLCMFIGASAGSTSGGMKCLRVILGLKYCYRELFTLTHPHSVAQIKIQGKPVSEEVMRSVLGFLGLYIGLFALSATLLAWLGVDLITSISAAASALGNVGPGFGRVGPAGNFSLLPCSGKWLLTACMLLGRLEIDTLIILLLPEFWRK